MTTSPALDPAGRTPARDRPPASIPVFAFEPVPRPRMHSALDAVVARHHGGTLLICGAVGTGKTVTVADWAATHLPRTHPELRIEWCTVRDRAPLWSRLHAQLCASSPGSGRPPTGIGEAEAVRSALAEGGHPTVLVIDDAHLVTDPLALAGLEHFLQNAPATLTTIICARFAPPIRWQLLRPQSRLARWTGPDLALSPEEAAHLCAGHGCRLDRAGLDLLMTLTGGQGALVRIAAIRLAAAHPGDSTGMLATWTRPLRPIADLLVGELIDALAPPLRRLLTYTSVPEEFTEQLADELIGEGAAELLHELDRIDFPMTTRSRGGRTWYSYHPLLRAYFLAEIDRQGPNLGAELRLRAARALTAAGELPDALALLLAVPDRRPLMSFLSEHALTLVFADHGESLFDALATAAPGILTDPFLHLVQAVDALLHGGSGIAQAYRDSARTLAAEDPHSLAGPYRLEALTAAVDAELAVATRNTSEPIVFPDRMPPADRPDLDGYLAVSTGTALAMRGELGRGEERLRIALSRTGAHSHPRLRLLAVTRLAVTAGLAGSITTMRQRAGRACAIARDHDLLDLPDTVHATALEAYGAYLQGADPQPEQIRILCAEHIRRDGTPGPVAGWLPHVVGSLLDCRSGTEPCATARLRRSIGRLLDSDPPATLGGGLLSAAVWALLGTGDTASAVQLVERARSVFGVTPDTVLCAAALTAMSGHHQAVAGQVQPVLAAGSGAHPVARLTGWLLHARAHRQLGSESEIRAAMDNALRIGATHRISRPFFDIPGTLELLDRYAGSSGYCSVFADSLRTGWPARQDPEQPLTGTELRILRQLPSGRTDQHIADDLGVSVDTVRTQLGGVYAKLGTRTRGETLQQARRSGLL